jgi:hypothetical protein
LLEDITDSSKRGGRYLAAFGSGIKMIWTVAFVQTVQCRSTALALSHDPAVDDPRSVRAFEARAVL